MRVGHGFIVALWHCPRQPVLDLCQGSHCGVPGGGHGKGTVGGTIVDGELCIVMGDKAVDKPAGKGIPSADPVVYLKFFPGSCLEETAIMPADCPPVIDTCAAYVAQCRGGGLEVGKFATTLVIMFLKFSTSRPVIFSSTPSTSKPRHAVKSSSLPIMTSTCRAISPVDLLCPGLSANGLP